MIVFNWGINLCHYDSETGFISSVEWFCNATEEHTYSAGAYGVAEFDDGFGFAYENATEADVLNRLWSVIDRKKVEATLQQNIFLKKRVCENAETKSTAKKLQLESGLPWLK